MGLRGPIKRPTAVERAEGFPGHRKPSDHEPVFPEGEPDMPSGLTAPARKVWRETVAELSEVSGLLTRADRWVLADFCEVEAEKEKQLRAMRESVKRAIEEAKAAQPDEKTSDVEIEAAVYAKYARTIDRLRHRANILRREIGGLSASARSSTRLAGAQKEKQDSEDAATFSRRPRLVAM